MIDPDARVDPDCDIASSAVIRQFASVTGGTVIGPRTSVSPFAMLHGPVIGADCRISGGVMMGPGFWIGDRVFIGPNVTLCNDAWPWADKAGYEPELFDGTQWAVIVESGASIGAGAVVLPGVRIGANAMIGAGAVVFHSVPANHVLSVTGEARLIKGAPRRMKFAC